MKSHTNDARPLALSSETLGRALRSRAVWLGSISALVWSFPEASLSVLGTVLHVIFGWIEIGLKSLLEGAFGLSHRAAQVVVAWGGMGVLLVALFLGVKRCWRLATELLAVLRSAALVSIAVLRLVHLKLLVGHAALTAAGIVLVVYGLG